MVQEYTFIINFRTPFKKGKWASQIHETKLLLLNIVKRLGECLQGMWSRMISPKVLIILSKLVSIDNHLLFNCISWSKVQRQKSYYIIYKTFDSAFLSMPANTSIHLKLLSAHMLKRNTNYNSGYFGNNSSCN